MSNQPQRKTWQREAILELLAGTPAFYSAQDIFESLTRQDTPVGLATIYRTLNGMVASHEVDVVMLEDGQSLFRLCGTSHHHHIRCKKCGVAKEVTSDKLEKLADDLAFKLGFTDIEHTIEISGICKECAKRK